MIAIQLTRRELITIAFTAALTGATCIALIVIFFVLPRRDAESAARVETAYIKGVMAKISSPKNCSSWIVLRNGKVNCEN